MSDDNNFPEEYELDDNPEQDESELDLEGEYKKAIRIMQCIDCMTDCDDKADLYRQTAKLFNKMSGYQDAGRYAEECKRLAKLSADDVKRKIYQEALSRKNTAKQPEEYQRAAEGFRKVKDYKDANDLADQCELLRDKIEKKATVKRILNNGLLIILLLAVIIFSATSHAKYYYANVCKLTGSYEAAIKTYKKLGAYKDCRERLTETRYQYGVQAEKDKNYALAQKEFTAAGDYKDSVDRAVSMEKALIGKSKPGAVIRIGKYNWILLDTVNNNALLIKKAAVTGKPYQINAGAVTWETSSLRQWLNSEFLDTNFTAAERQQIVQSNVTNNDNPQYGTSGGNVTQDYIYIINADEAKQYKKKLPTFKKDSWLRLPGNSQDTTAFLTVKGSVMTYGYSADSTEMAVYPLMWFNYK